MVDGPVLEAAPYYCWDGGSAADGVRGERGGRLHEAPRRLGSNKLGLEGRRRELVVCPLAAHETLWSQAQEHNSLDRLA